MKRVLFCAALACAALASACQPDGVLREIEQREKAKTEWRAKIAAESPGWIAAHARESGAVTTPSGLVYRIVTPAPDPSLPPPSAEGEVEVHYEGRLLDGTVFDSSFERGESAQFPLSGVIPGFREALLVMRPGEEIIAYLPSDIAYGPSGSPPDIPPNAALQFRIVMLAHRGADGRIVVAPQIAAQAAGEGD